MAQIEVTEEFIRNRVDGWVFEQGELIASQVSGLSVSGMTVEATADGMRVTARVLPTRLDGECECADSIPCGHVVAALLVWVWSTTPADDAASLLAEFQDALADEKLDLELLDELTDDLEELLDEEPEAVRDLAERVMALVEAREDDDLTDLLERVEELWLEARQVAGPALCGHERPQALLERAHRGQHRARLVPAVRHAVVAARVLASAERVPVRRLQQLLVRLRVAVGQQVARPLPAEQRVGGHAPRRAGEVALALQEMGAALDRLLDGLEINN